MVVMELLEGAVTWQSSMLLTTDKILLQEAIKKLHGAVWVHGDIRGNNVLLVLYSNGSRLFLVDFDWAGRSGEARYPYFMSREVAWPPGASDGELIALEHDVHMINLLVSQY